MAATCAACFPSRCSGCSLRSLCTGGIAKELEKRRGEKPKASTIYPALKELKSNGMITGSKKGKIITYSLTSKGRGAEANVAKSYFVRCLEQYWRNDARF